MIKKEQLQEYLWSVGLMPTEGMLIVDERYVFPTEEWVRNSFLPAWAEYKKNLDQVGDIDAVESGGEGLRQLRGEDGGLCSGPARSQRDADGVRAGQKPPAALCFGWMAYVRERDPSPEGHAINFTIVQADDARAGQANEPKMLFIDGGLKMRWFH
jgi:hypothetical protein